MTDATIIPGPWAKPERKPDFGAIGKVVALCGDAFDVGMDAKSIDPSLRLNFAAKIEQHAANARLLAEEARMLKLGRVRWDLITEAERFETRAAEIEGDHS